MSDYMQQKRLYTVKDSEFRKGLYLDCSIGELIDKMNNLQLFDIGDNTDVPFTASMRSYIGAKDEDGNSWLLKKIPENEAYDHKLQEIAYYIDFLLNTIAAPNILKKINGTYYRVTKNVKNAMQISSYNYLEKPFMRILANDLINRWLFFDEDRNPNNYLVFHDRDSSPCVVVIDYNKADLKSTQMKITGNKDKFGWHRTEKTRFLTLLKTENFEKLSIETFEDRLSTMMSIPLELLESVTRESMRDPIIKNVSVQETATLVSTNISKRRTYINNYFRKWFKKRDATVEKAENDRYSGFGESFLNYYKGKKS